MAVEVAKPVTAKELLLYFDPPESVEERLALRTELFEPPETRAKLEKLKAEMAKMRCGLCRTRLLFSMRCKCQKAFCPKHRNPQTHRCSVDFKQMERQHMRDELTKPTSERLKGASMGKDPPMDDLERVLHFEVFRCGDVEEATSSDGVVYHFESATGNVRHYVCGNAPRCPGRVLVCHDGRGILLNPHSEHEEAAAETDESQASLEHEESVQDIQAKAGKDEVNAQQLEEDNHKEGVFVLKTSFPEGTPIRKTQKFDLNKPPTFEELIREVFEENAARFKDEEVVRAAAFDWIGNPDEESIVDVGERVEQWNRYEFIFFCDNRVLEKSLVVKGSAKKGSASLQLLCDGQDSSQIEKAVEFDLCSPLNLYEALQSYFNEHFLSKDYITSTVVYGAIFKFSPSNGEYAEIDEEDDYFEDSGKYKFVYFNGNAPPTAYIVYERICTMNYSTIDLHAAVVDTNNYAKKTVAAFCDDPRPSTTSELRLICPKRCTGDKREWRCSTCRKIVHFDGNRRFYCSCGGWAAVSTSFKCSSHLHKDEFTSFDNIATMKIHMNSVASHSYAARSAASPREASSTSQTPRSRHRRASERSRQRNGGFFKRISRLASAFSRELQNAFLV
ncbi:hypothetical protein QR680_008774 [Steinernema hermaphroditum]|uniref:AN1-type domain-containing protein n=1 Tax=Steinernema hermaphroditum TaxID=289476 RepID=A0AA39IHX8_9BILA|nr:hypothetical protein QR680_008774 [Steinernema hermaphroditum]